MPELTTHRLLATASRVLPITSIRETYVAGAAGVFTLVNSPVITIPRAFLTVPTYLQLACMARITTGAAHIKVVFQPHASKIVDLPVEPLVVPGTNEYVSLHTEPGNIAPVLRSFGGLSWYHLRWHMITDRALTLDIVFQTMWLYLFREPL